MATEKEFQKGQVTEIEKKNIKKIVENIYRLSQEEQMKIALNLEKINKKYFGVLTLLVFGLLYEVISGSL